MSRSGAFLLLLSTSSIQYSFAYLCGHCIFSHGHTACSNTNCLAQARHNFNNGYVDLVKSSGTKHKMQFSCHRGFRLMGHSTNTCNVCTDMLEHPPPICRETPVQKQPSVTEAFNPVVITSIRPTRTAPSQAKQKTSTDNSVVIWGSIGGLTCLVLVAIAAGLYIKKKRQPRSSFDDTELYAYPKIVQQNNVPPAVPPRPPPPRVHKTTAQDYLEVLPDVESTPEYSYITEEEKPTQNVMFVGDKGWKIVNGHWCKNTN